MARTHEVLTVLLLSASRAGASPAASQPPPDDAHAPKATIPPADLAAVEPDPGGA